MENHSEKPFLAAEGIKKKEKREKFCLAFDPNKNTRKLLKSQKLKVR